MRFPIQTHFTLPPLKILLYSLILLSILGSCTKNNGDGGEGGNKSPFISGTSPGSITTGATVTITGTNFGTIASNVTVTLGNLTFTPTSVTPTTIVFTVPTNLLASGSAIFSLHVAVDGLLSNTIQVTISYAYVEPRGWRYINKNMDGPGMPREIYFMDDPGNYGLAFGRGLLKATSSDGSNWFSFWPADHWGAAFHVYDEDEAWLEMNYHDLWVLDYAQANSTNFHARLDTISSIPYLQGKALTGAFITKRKHGYVMTHEGSVFKINGSFKPADISLEYQPSVYTNLPLIFDNNGFYAFSGADSSNFMIAGRPLINGVMTPMIIHKRNGIYKEYFFSASEIGYPHRIQCPDANNAYFLSLNFELYKFSTSTGAWYKMNAPRFGEIHFIDGNTGYASNAPEPGQEYRHIYKTTDGGQTWNPVFSLDQFHYIFALCSKNGKVWGVGEETNFHKNFVVKFNP